MLHRAVAWFAEHGVLVERVLSDNGSPYISHLWRDTCAQLGIQPKRTRPYRPQTNGEILRLHRTLADGWAYKKLYNSENTRRTALAGWLHQYNHHRPHLQPSAANHPISRLDNLAGHHSESRPQRNPRPARRKGMRAMAVEDARGAISFDAWVAARQASLQRFAYLVSGSAADAPDLLQDALSRAWPRWDSLAARGTAEAYVRRSIVNGAVSRWRQHHRADRTVRRNRAPRSCPCSKRYQET